MKLATFALAMTLYSADRSVEGNPASPVRVLVYEDLQCPDCATFRRMMDEHLLRRFGAKVAFEHRDFPLPKHNWARKAAVAARFFDGQKAGVGVAFRRQTMERLGQITLETFDEHVRAFARAQGVDGAQAVAALDDPKLQALVEEDYQEGIARGVAKTPTVLVNGKPYVETFSVAEISSGIEAALRESAR